MWDSGRPRFRMWACGAERFQPPLELFPSLEAVPFIVHDGGLIAIWPPILLPCTRPVSALIYIIRIDCT